MSKSTLIIKLWFNGWGLPFLVVYGNYAILRLLKEVFKLITFCRCCSKTHFWNHTLCHFFQIYFQRFRTTNHLILFLIRCILTSMATSNSGFSRQSGIQANSAFWRSSEQRLCCEWRLYWILFFCPNVHKT